MADETRTLLWHACQAANAIATMTAGRTLDDYNSDIMLRSAVERQFEIVGEAFRQLSQLDPAMAGRVPDLPQIVAFRNILIHGYAVVDPARVWRTVETDLPQLRAALDALLNDG